jgi:hypothetical protein
LMLASTVQFSRYGRPRDETRRIRSGPSRSRRETSRARSLRTQQRARPPCRLRHRSAPRKRGTYWTDIAGELAE